MSGRAAGEPDISDRSSRPGLMDRAVFACGGCPCAGSTRPGPDQGRLKAPPLMLPSPPTGPSGADTVTDVSWRLAGRSAVD